MGLKYKAVTFTSCLCHGFTSDVVQVFLWQCRMTWSVPSVRLEEGGIPKKADAKKPPGRKLEGNSRDGSTA